MPNALPGGARVLVAGVSTRAFAESAARAGYDVTAVDAFGDLDQHTGVRAYSLPRDFGVEFTATNMARVVASLECDAVAYLSPFENHPRLVERLTKHARLLGNDTSVLQRARDPIALGLDTRSTREPARWLLKPRASGGGHGIRWWTPGEPVPRGFHVQPFVEGTSGSIVFVADGRAIVPIGLTRQIVGDDAFGASGFRYCGSILVADATLLAAAATLAATLAQKLELVGVNCVDFVAHDGAPIPVEVNPRCSASMELAERAYGVSVFGAHAIACTGGYLPAFDLAHAWPARECTGKAVVFARRDVICGNTREWLGDTALRDVPHPDEHIAAGRPVCTVFAEGASVDDCYAALVRRANAVYETLDAWASVAQ